MNEKTREIIKHISDAALELAFVRHGLTSDEVDVDDDADVKTRVTANEAFLEDLKRDTLNCLTGDDTGCLDPEELDESNCELLWLESALATVRQETRAAAFGEAAQKLRDKGDDWRLQAERWQQNAQNAGMDIIREQDYADRDVCLSKMSAAMTLAIELDEAAANSVPKDSEPEGENHAKI